MMWFEYNATTNTWRHDGWYKKEVGDTLVLTSSPTTYTSVSDAKHAEYLQIIEFDQQNRTVKFARDYLGFCPLLYTIADNSIFISDLMSDITRWLRQKNIKLTLSEEGIALYFVMGCVPQGYTVFNEIKACENANAYQFQKGNVKKTNTFDSINIDSNVSLSDVKETIISEVSNLTDSTQQTSIWCSGGLDSTCVTHCAKLTNNPTSLITFSYPKEIAHAINDGESPYIQQVSDYYDLPLKKPILTVETYNQMYQNYISSLSTPIYDLGVPVKFYLATQTSQLGLTGEGGDLLFAGQKKDMMFYMLERHPNLNLGSLYAIAHQRFFQCVAQLFKEGSRLTDFVTDYFNQQFKHYEGSLLQKLFYLNVFLKQGSLIFPENYYAARASQVQVKHPLTALSVYNMTSKLPDQQRYVYPKAKLALLNMFKDDLPSEIIHRKKVGTLLPLYDYLKERTQPVLNTLLESQLFNEAFLLSATNTDRVEELDYLLYYAIMCLNDYVNHHMEAQR